MRGEKEEEEEESLLSVWFYVTCASARAVLYRRWAFVRKNFIDTTTLLRSRQRPLDAPSSRLFECWTPPPPPFSFCSALPSYSFFSFLFFFPLVYYELMAEQDGRHHKRTIRTRALGPTRKKVRWKRALSRSFRTVGAGGREAPTLSYLLGPPITLSTSHFSYSGGN